jgi:hypothetical protein
MKKALILLVLVIGAASMFALPLNPGQMQVNAGTGVGWGLPLYVGVDYGITPDITVGGEATVYFWDGTYFSVVANGNYHFLNLLNLPSNTDLYAGLSLGVNSWYSSWLNLYGQVGGRYYFTDRLGANLEFNGGRHSGAKIGITYKL